MRYAPNETLTRSARLGCCNLDAASSFLPELGETPALDRAFSPKFFQPVYAVAQKAAIDSFIVLP